MGQLDAAARNDLPSSDFADPKNRAYPIENRAHAANAEARVAQQEEKGNVTKAYENKIDAAVHRKYPDMGQSGPGNAHPNHNAGKR